MTAVISSELTSGVQFISGLRRCCGNVRQRECTGNALRWAGSVVPSRRGKGAGRARNSRRWAVLAWAVTCLRAYAQREVASGV